MPKSRAELNAIMREDAKRRNAREAAEESLLMQSGYVPEGVDPYHYSRAIKGVPTNAHRTIRATENNWTTHYYRDEAGALMHNKTRCIGGDVTVIHADGSTEVRSVNSFRKEHIATKQRKHTKARVVKSAAQTYQDRVNQLGAIGNID